MRDFKGSRELGMRRHLLLLHDGGQNAGLGRVEDGPRHVPRVPGVDFTAHSRSLQLYNKRFLKKYFFNYNYNY